MRQSPLTATCRQTNKTFRIFVAPFSKQLLCAFGYSVVSDQLQAEHYDKDERYMAINDLKEELQREVRIDSVLEKRICDVVLLRLEKDTCNDVRAMAVQWYVVFVL